MPFALVQPLGWLVQLFEFILEGIHDTLGVGWGMSIVLLTVLVRAALIPLTLKQFKSMQSLTRLAPEIKALQAKYKDDKQKLNEEMMAFYRENKVNPLGSCLPLVAQMPVFLSLFYLLQDDLREDICGQSARPCGEIATSVGEAFLFIPDLTDKATGWVLVILIVLYIGSQLLSSLLMATSTDRNQKILVLALPFLFVFFILNFPAGLIVYWITTNLWTIVQQAIVRKRLGPLKPPDLAAATDVEGVPAGRELAVAGVGATSGRAAPPPPSPRKKKKRSGKRR